VNDPLRALLLTLLPVLGGLTVLLVVVLLVARSAKEAAERLTLPSVGMRSLLISLSAAVVAGRALEALRDTPAEWGNMQRRGFTQR
jgi:hypothetical protein